MVMYGIYNSETLEKLINTVHNTTTPNEKLFTSMLNSWYTWYLTENGVHNYAIILSYI